MASKDKKTRGLNFNERNVKQHKNRMNRLLTIIRKGVNCTEKDYEDISCYCTDVNDVSNSGKRFQKRLLKATNINDCETQKDWCECVILIEAL